MWLDPQANAISMNFYSHGSSRIQNRINQRLWAFEVPRSPGFVLGLPPRGGSKNIPSDHETWTIQCHVGIHWKKLNPSCIHMLRWSLKRTWTSSAFSTNESAWNAMVTCAQFRVWSGPKLHAISFSILFYHALHRFWYLVSLTIWNYSVQQLLDWGV